MYQEKFVSMVEQAVEFVTDAHAKKLGTKDS